MKIKQWSKVPRDFWNIVERIVKLMGKGDQTKSEEYTLDSLNSIRIDLFDTEKTSDRRI